VTLLGEQAGVWQGRVLVWQPEDAGAYGVGEYVVSFSPSLADGAGRPLAGPGSVRFFHRGEGDVVWVEPSQVPVRAFSAFGNDHFLHGRPYVASVGLYDHRARFYEARTGTFLEPDPLGPVDSPNLYAAFGFDALSVTDPCGLIDAFNWDRDNRRQYERWLKGELPTSPEERAFEKALGFSLLGFVVVPVMAFALPEATVVALVSGSVGVASSILEVSKLDMPLDKKVDEVTRAAGTAYLGGAFSAVWPYRWTRIVLSGATSAGATVYVLKKRNGEAGLSEQDWASVASSGVAGALATAAAEGTKGTALAKEMVGGAAQLGLQLLAAAYNPPTLPSSQENAYRRVLLMRSCHNECKEGRVQQIPSFQVKLLPSPTEQGLAKAH
jgi:RHS repeat-associated protein